METHKLKLDKFKHIEIFNLPNTIDLGIETATKNYVVLIYYVDKLEDVDTFIKLVVSSQLPRATEPICYTKKDVKME